MDFLAEILPFLLKGAVTTIQLTVVSMALALVAGLALALMRLSRSKPLRFLSGAYIEIIRARRCSSSCSSSIMACRNMASGSRPSSPASSACR